MIRPSEQAKELLAEAVEGQGPSWRNAANSIRAGGYANAWITAGLVAIEKALRVERDDAV